jgi:signal transduction histidine kinase
MQPFGWTITAIVWVSAFSNDPGPSFSGRGLAVLGCLVVGALPLPAMRLRRRVMGGEPTVAVVLAIAGVLAAAGIALTALQQSGTGYLLPGVAIFLAVQLLPLDVAIGFTVAATVGLAITELLAAGSSGADLASVILLSLLLAVTAHAVRRAATGEDETERLYAELQDARDEQARAAATAERNRIAGELHDVLAHSLSGAAIQLQGARRLLDRSADVDPAATQAVDNASRLVRDGLADARRAVSALRGDDLPTVEHLGDLVAAVRRDLDLDARLVVEGTAAPLPTEASVALYRGAQEALTNAARYAPGAQVTVTLRYAGDGGGGVTLVVEDARDAGAPDAETPLRGAGGGHGLEAMRERLVRAGGTMEAGPTARGWRVALEVA